MNGTCYLCETYGKIVLIPYTLGKVHEWAGVCKECAKKWSEEHGTH